MDRRAARAASSFASMSLLVIVVVDVVVKDEGEFFFLLKSKDKNSSSFICQPFCTRTSGFGPKGEILLYASTQVTFYFVLCHSHHFSVTLHHHCLTILLTVCYRYFSSLRLPSFIPFFVTDLFRPYFVPSIIPRFCGWTILP